MTSDEMKKNVSMYYRLYRQVHGYLPLSHTPEVWTKADYEKAFKNMRKIIQQDLAGAN